MEQTTKKRTAIRQKLKRMALLLSCISLLFAGLVGLIGMISIRARSIAVLKSQTEQNLLAAVTHKTEDAEMELKRITDYAQILSDFTHTLYKNPGHFKPIPVNRPLQENAGKYALQRCFASESYQLHDVQDEMFLLGNLEQVYTPIISLTRDMEMNIYVGSESGFLIGYDRDSGYDGEEGEDYYDFFKAEWYQLAKESGKAVFTDVYNDSIGRGLMISCASPFYSAQDAFAGAFCLDIHIDKIYEAIVDTALFPGARAFVIDRQGNAISQETAKNMYDEATLDKGTLQELKALATGVRLANDGMYYAYAPIKTTDWELCLCIPQKTVMAPIYEMNRHIYYAIFAYIVCLALVVAIVLVSARRIARSLSAPLEALTKDVEAISSGNLNQRARIFENDEIGDVAQSINDMADALKKHIESLTSMTAEKQKITNELNIAKQMQDFYTKAIDQLS